jgi:hypothetical protein
VTRTSVLTETLSRTQELVCRIERVSRDFEKKRLTGAVSLGETKDLVVQKYLLHRLMS